MRQIYTLRIYIAVTRDYMQTGLLGTSSCTGLYERKISSKSSSSNREEQQPMPGEIVSFLLH